MPFNNVIGQDIAIKALKNITAQNQVRGAYLFLGPRGVGKRTTSIEFAKAINCEEREGNGNCNCSSCNKIDSMNHPDVFMIHPEGPSYSIRINRIREIIYQASLKPYEGRKRIFIINDAEEMTEEAQNALLKLLEEPSQNHILIVIASNIAGLLTTVLSRCKSLKFYSLSHAQMREFLKARNIEEKEALLFSHMAMGSPGRAVDFKEKNIIAQRDRVLSDFFFRKDALLEESELNKEISEDIEGSLYMLLCWYRDLLVARFTKERCELLNIDRFEEISSFSNRFSEERLEKGLLTIMKTIGYLRRNINPKIALFNMAIELKRS